MEDRVERGKQWLESILSLMGVAASVSSEGFAKITEDQDSCWLNIQGDRLTKEQIQLLIGDKGKNIDAIQYLANTLLNIEQDAESQGSYTVEIESYRVNRYQELRELVDRATEAVRSTGEEQEISGLSSAERKQIHYLFQDSSELATESRGQEPDRKLIVKTR